MNSTDIASIIKTLTDSGFAEAELKLEDLYLRVSNRSSVDGDGVPVAVASPRAEATARSEERPAPTQAPDASRSATITSPTLGTFYRAPSPGADPFIKVGDRIEAGQQVGIVEVMKLFNSVDSDVAGTVVEIHAQDAELVEHGQVLITVALD